MGLGVWQSKMMLLYSNRKLAAKIAIALKNSKTGVPYQPKQRSSNGEARLG
jgi:hypothetical protein